MRLKSLYNNKNTLLLFLIFLSIACKQSTNSLVEKDSTHIRINKESKESSSTLESQNKIVVSQDNYNGTYHLSGRNKCEMLITIKDDMYSVKTNKRTQSGTIDIIKSNSLDTYILFKNLFGDDPKTEIEGKYEDGTITIQNYGNTLNPYTRISECGDKFLLLKKTNQ